MSTCPGKKLIYEEALLGGVNPLKWVFYVNQQHINRRAKNNPL